MFSPNNKAVGTEIMFIYLPLQITVNTGCQKKSLYRDTTTFHENATFYLEPTKSTKLQWEAAESVQIAVHHVQYTRHIPEILLRKKKWRFSVTYVFIKWLLQHNIYQAKNLLRYAILFNNFSSRDWHSAGAGAMNMTPFSLVQIN